MTVHFDDDDGAATPDDIDITERGSFAHAACTRCGWIGHARRSRTRARRDATEHRRSCLGVTGEKF